MYFDVDFVLAVLVSVVCCFYFGLFWYLFRLVVKEYYCIWYDPIFEGFERGSNKYLLVDK